MKKACVSYGRVCLYSYSVLYRFYKQPLYFFSTVVPGRILSWLDSNIPCIVEAMV